MTYAKDRLPDFLALLRRAQADLAWFGPVVAPRQPGRARKSVSALHKRIADDRRRQARRRHEGRHVW